MDFEFSAEQEQLRETVRRAREKAGHLGKIEVEVDSLAAVDEALDAGADVLLLDNMSVAQVAEAVKRVEGRALLEVSGGLNLEMVAEYAATGVGFLSIGALTHSAAAVDISLRIQPLADHR